MLKVNDNPISVADIDQAFTMCQALSSRSFLQPFDLLMRLTHLHFMDANLKVKPVK